jgi:hypothetical protein
MEKNHAPQATVPFRAGISGGFLFFVSLRAVIQKQNIKVTILESFEWRKIMHLTPLSL